MSSVDNLESCDFIRVHKGMLCTHVLHIKQLCCAWGSIEMSIDSVLHISQVQKVNLHRCKGSIRSPKQEGSPTVVAAL